MTSCNELFQERQRLLKERADVQANLSKVKKLQASNQFPDDEAIKKESANFKRDINDPANIEDIDQLVADSLDNAKDTPEVNIPKGQPSNFAQLNREYPEEVVKKYALFNKSLMNSGKRLMPDQWEFIYDNPFDAADKIAETLTHKMSADEVLNLINTDAQSFNSVVEKTMRIRAVYQSSHKALLDRFDDLEKFMDNNTKPTQVPSKLLNKLMDTYKVALMSERQYDFVRNSWSKQGFAMQGGGFKELELDIKSGKLEDDLDISSEIDTVESVRDMKPEDFGEETPIGRIFAAADLFRTDRNAAMKQLELEIKNARIVGFDPFKIYDPNNWPDRMHRLTNVLAKDQQLFNLRTQFLNVGSNGIMALYGPFRKFHEDALYVPVGTKMMWGDLPDAYYEQLQNGMKGYGAAIKSIRDSGKEVFLDAFNNKSMHYAGQIDTYGKYFKSTEEQLQELERLRDWRPKTKKGKMLMAANPVWWRRWAHSTVRLWGWEKTKHPFWLRPGLTSLAAVDNLGGFFFHNYALRTDLEVKARRDGVQLKLLDDNGNLDRAKMDDWIEKQVQEASYKTQVTEKMRLAYRKETGLTPDIVDDVEIENIIREEKVAETYGAPVIDNDFVKNAARFSEDLRFQAVPTDKNIGKGIYKAIDSARKDSWAADVMFPYLLAPFKGSSLDFTLTGMGPLLDTMKIFTNQGTWTAKEIARVKANAAMAGFVYGTYGFLSANNLIIGNGPLDPKEREEWKYELSLEGKKPNSIVGVPLVGGLPVISTLFLLEDLRAANERSNISKYDNTVMIKEIFAVLVGHLTRHTSLGNVKQLMDLIYGDEYGNHRAGKYAGYIASGQLPFIGPVREAERLAGTKASQVYRPRDLSEEEKTLLDEFKFKNFEDGLRDKILNLYPSASLLGGQYKDKDWLGSKIRLAWGENASRFAKYNFFPGVHPEGEDKVYAELNRLNLLNPPGPLMKKTLEGVPMSDDLQKLYNDSYSQMTGNQAMLVVLKEASMNPSYTFDPEVYNYTIKSGALKGQRLVRKYSDQNGEPVMKLNLAVALHKHVKNKTPIQAFRSLINDPFYKKLMSNPATTADLRVRDMARKELTQQIPYRLMETIKEYYGLLTLNSINVSDHPAAVEFREMRDAMLAAETAKTAEENTGFVEALKVFTGK